MFFIIPYLAGVLTMAVICYWPSLVRMCCFFKVLVKLVAIILHDQVMGRGCLAEVEGFLADLNESRKLEATKALARDPKSHENDSNCKFTIPSNPARFLVPDPRTVEIRVDSDGVTSSASLKRQCEHDCICDQTNTAFEAFSNRLTTVERELKHNSVRLSALQILNLKRSGIQYNRRRSSTVPSTPNPAFDHVFDNSFATSSGGHNISKKASSAKAVPPWISTGPPATPAPPLTMEFLLADRVRRCRNLYQRLHCRQED